MKTFGKILFLILLLVPSAALLAKGTTSVEVKHGTVVSVFADQLVVKMADGKTEEITVPQGFTFTVDGKQVGLDDLQPGTEINAKITTTKTPHVVKTTEVKNGEVMKVIGNNTVWFKENGVIKSYQVTPNFTLLVDGKKTEVHDLRPGDKLTAEIVYTAEHTVTTREVHVSGKAPAKPAYKAAAKPKAEAAPAPKAETAKAEAAPAGEAAPAEPAKTAHHHHKGKLPTTGSPLPLLGLLGALFLAAGLVARRAARN